MRTTSWARASVASALLIGSVGWTTASEAAAATPPSASIDAVSCTDGQGGVDVTVVAGDDAQHFSVSLTDSLGRDSGYESRDVAAGQSDVVHVADLDDDVFALSVDAYLDDPGEEDDDAYALLVDAQPLTVACDAAPAGSYANPRAALAESCGAQVDLRADNRPIGGNTADLQPVRFTVTYQSVERAGGGDDSGAPPALGGSTDERVAADPGPVVLDTFTLDAATPTYRKTYEPADGQDYFYGTVTVSAEGTTITSADVGECLVDAPVATSGGAALPDTGA